MSLFSSIINIYLIPPSLFSPSHSTQEEIIRVDAIAGRVGTTQSLRNAFEPILNSIIAALDATAVFVRTKALRALSQILTIDSSVLSNVRRLFQRIITALMSFV